MFVGVARVVLRLGGATEAALVAALGDAAEVARDAAHAVLDAVAGAEERAVVSPGAKPVRSRCALNRCRRYHLAKALSVPPCTAPLLITRTATTVILVMYGCVCGWARVRVMALCEGVEGNVLCVL